MDGALECTICEAIVKLADGYIENNATEVGGVMGVVFNACVTVSYVPFQQEVLAVLQNFCNDLGPIATLVSGLLFGLVSFGVGKLFHLSNDIMQVVTRVDLR